GPNCSPLLECLAAGRFSCLGSTPSGAFAVGATCVDRCAAQFQAFTGVSDINVIKAQVSDPSTMAGDISADVAALDNNGTSCLRYSFYLPASLVINEVDFDQPGNDTAEFVEILNGAATSSDLTGCSVVLSTQCPASNYLTVPLSGTLQPGEYLVVGTSS